MGADADAVQRDTPLRLHLACGDVYLRGYVNVDAVGQLAGENPQLTAANATVVEQYFKRPYCKRLLGHDKRGRVVVDVRAEVTDLSMFADESVDEVLAVNLIDHLRFQDVPQAVAEWRRVLKTEGDLIIDVGDARSNAELLLLADNREALEWALRLIYCHSRDRYDSHHWGYTTEYLEELMAAWGFGQVWTKRDYIDHVYPSFQSCFRKSEH